jgi:hypothetical protein
VSATEHAMILDAMRHDGCDCPDPTIKVDENHGQEWRVDVFHDEGCPIVVRRGMGNGRN